MDPSRNVLGGPLDTCSTEPLTGWYRDGCCNTDGTDRGLHTVCAVVNEAFLAHAKAQGNDLVTPAQQFGFPGLVPGDRWCVCAGTWLRAAQKGQGCPVDLEATHERTLEVVPLEVLELHAL